MSSKLERDIEEVLAQIDQFPPKRSRWSRIRRRVANAIGGVGEAISSIPWPHISVGHVLLIAIAVIVIAYYGFRNSNIGGIVIFGGILVFIAAFVFSLRRQSASRSPEKRWRGQPIDLDEPGGSWWKRWRSRR
ncbi:MAG: hypothetical protein IIC87_02320 [Chloroflexi bacterium]|nr:hypothetical protein [Chloroflexota bacterium]